MSELPIAVWSGTFRLFGVEVRCHRLSDGRNIIEEESMATLLRALESGTLDIGDIEEFSRFQRGYAPRDSWNRPAQGVEPK